MQALAQFHLKDDRNLDELMPLIKREEAYVWRAWRDGIVRQVWNVAGRTAGIALLEVSSLAQAEDFLSQMPAVKEGLVETQVYLLAPFSGFEVLFETDVMTHLNDRGGEH